MKLTLYIDLEGFDDGDFDTRNDYYKSNEDFFDALEAENKRNKNVAYEVVSNLGKNSNLKISNFSNDGRKQGNNAKSNTYKTEITLFNEDGKEETVDNLITNCFSQDVVVNLFEFNRENMDAEFEEDYKFWCDEHDKIQSYKDKIDENTIWQYEPTRTYKAEFLNNANEVKYAKFENCKIIEKEGVDKYYILVEKITLIDSL